MDNVAVIKPYIGMQVLFRTVRDANGRKETLDWPGLVYKTYEDGSAGVGVLYDGGWVRYGKVLYSEELKENCWTPLKHPEVK